MATYRADVTQSVEPAQANTATLAKGAEAAAAGARIQTESTANLLKTAEFAIKSKIDYDMAGVESEAEQATQDFFESNMKVSQEADVLAATPKNQTALDSNYQIINVYDQQLKRLVDASKGGMSNEDYVARVSSLTRKAIAKYPGLSDQIREKVGTITGLPYADRWAEMQYVRDRFSKQEKAPNEFDPMKIVAKDIEAASKAGTFGSQEELFTLYQKDRGAYDDRIRAFNQHLATKTATEALTTNVAGLKAQSDFQADQNRGMFVAMFNGVLGTSVTSASVTNLENTYKPVLVAMSKGQNIAVNPVAFDVQIKMHNAQMKTSIESARTQALNELQKYFINNPNVSDTKRKEMEADINNAAEYNLKTYADDKGVGLAAMSAIMVNYRDRNLKEQKELIDLAIKQQGAMQNNSLVMAYWAGGEHTENLKRTNPSFYEFMVNQENILRNNMMGVSSSIQGASQLASVNNIITAAQQGDGGAVKANANDEPGAVRAAHEVMQSTTNTALDNAKEGKILSPFEYALISSTFTTNAVTGANSKVLKDQYVKLGEKIKLLPEEEQRMIRKNTSKGVKEGYMALRSLKEGIGAKYGFVLGFGIAPDGKLTMGQFNDVYRTQSYTPSAPRSAQESKVKTYPRNIEVLRTQAEAELRQKGTALFYNLVYTRAMMTGESLQAVSVDIMSKLHDNEPYNGFDDETAKTPANTPTYAEIPAGALANQDAMRREIEGTSNAPAQPATNASSTTSGKTERAPTNKQPKAKTSANPISADAIFNQLNELQ
jgi:hypothetical protein